MKITFRLALLSILMIVVLVRCSKTSDSNFVEIHTKFGTMKVLLYDDTPIHKANFLSLVECGAYDSLLFHRVVKNFMIQGGDPLSRNAPQSRNLGNGEIGEPLKAEILFPLHFHKRGALAAARKADKVNPDKMSSGSQFYIVQGDICSDEQMDEVETLKNNAIRSNIFYQIDSYYHDSLQYYQDKGMSIELADLQMRIMGRVSQMAEEQGLFTIPEDVRQVYRTQGGVPRLDGEYTVFGEVVEGFDVIDSIAAQPVDEVYHNMHRTDRPLSDIKMSINIVK